MPNTKIAWEIRGRSTGTLLILFQRRCHSGILAAITTWLAPSVTRRAYSGSHPFVNRVYDQAHNVLETHEHDGDFREQKNDCWNPYANNTDTAGHTKPPPTPPRSDQRTESLRAPIRLEANTRTERVDDLTPRSPVLAISRLTKRRRATFARELNRELATFERCPYRRHQLGRTKVVFVRNMKKADRLIRHAAYRVERHLVAKRLRRPWQSRVRASSE